MNKRVVITGLGVISSVGIGWEEFWDGLLKGKSGISPVSSFDTANHFTHNGGQVKNFKAEQFISDDKLKSLSRASQMALAATKLAIGDASLSKDEMSKMTVGTCIGTTMGSVQTREIINELIVLRKDGFDDERLQVPTPPPFAMAKNLAFLVKYDVSTACAAVLCNRVCV
jgi:3-oxoacyl-(acyl-carrier-protein) synthase